MSGVTPTTEGLLTLIETQLAWPVDRTIVSGASKLGQKGVGLDSIMLIEAAITIEESFGINIPDESIAGLADTSLEDIVTLVAGLQDT